MKRNFKTHFISGGKREDLNNIYFRSKEEANIARFFKYNKLLWEYEPRIFYFEGIRRGTVSYKPDFRVLEDNKKKWFEVKGFMDSKSITALRRFKKYYPEEFEKLILITQGKRTADIAQELEIPFIQYEEIEFKMARLIPMWEYTR